MTSCGQVFFYSSDFSQKISFNTLTTVLFFKVSGLCLNPVSMEHGIMVAGIILGCDLVFVALHLIGEKLNRDYRKLIHNQMQKSAEADNQISPLDDVTK
jgi:hypothetical protein